MALVETAKYPSVLATEADMLNWKNITPSATQPTLSGAITNTSTTITLAAGTGAQLPADNFAISIDDEVIFVTSRSTDTLTVGQRGYEGTSAAAHNSGASVWARVTAKSHNQIVSEIAAIESNLGVAMKNVAQYQYTDWTAVTANAASSGVDQNLKTYSLGTNFFDRTNKTIRIRAGGTYSTLANATFFMKIVLLNTASLAVFSTLTMPASATTSQDWHLDAIVACTTTGATGTLRTSGVLVMNKQGLPGDAFIDTESRTESGHNLTGAHSVLVAVQVTSTASTSNSFTQNFMMIEKIG